MIIRKAAFLNTKRGLAVRAAAVLLLVVMCVSPSPAYSVLTHEEIVDLLWPSEIQPLLLRRYPGLTPDQLRKAHAYAYGGAVIQDLGYYPFGSQEFSELTHYVRSGDFVRELVRQSQDPNEFAFALGALSHYAADLSGHPAVNRSVAIEYPKLRSKFGSVVLYADDKSAHLKTEFGFDTAQVSRSRYAPEQYHDFIGFEVSEPLLERTFPIVYGLQLKDVLAHEELAVGTYRFAISHLIPKMTDIALQVHKKELYERPDFAKKKFLFRLSRSAYEKEWGRTYQRPGFGTRFLAALLRFVPKIGPFKGMAYHNPTPATEDMYIKSINSTVDHYRALLRAVRAGSLDPSNNDLDTGQPTRAAEYSLADDIYAGLLAKLANRKFDCTSPELRNNILAFYSDPAKPIATKKHSDRWQELENQLGQLKAATPVYSAAVWYTADPAPQCRPEK